jgi:ABC-type nitrate/sulfonate/bicarbonate transport system substrate-binding protein
VKERNVGFSLVPALLTRKVDAVLGAFENIEAVDLRERKKDPDVINVADAGIPPYDELVLVATEDSLEDKGELIRGFVGALARGTADARNDSEAAAGHLLEAARGLDRDLTLAQIEATLPAFEPPRGKPFGYLVPQEWERFTGFMVDSGLLKEAPEGAYTNEWVPGEGL